MTGVGVGVLGEGAGNSENSAFGSAPESNESHDELIDDELRRSNRGTTRDAEGACCCKKRNNISTDRLTKVVRVCVWCMGGCLLPLMIKEKIRIREKARTLSLSS